MARKKTRRAPITAMDRALDELYEVIPEIPACNGWCAESCGPVAMSTGEWNRIKRTGHDTKVRDTMTCPLLSPTGRCKVYTVRPLICRLWGATKEMRCPKGCEPTRWISIAEASELFERVKNAAGPGVAGPLGDVGNLWDAIALEKRAQRSAIIEALRIQKFGGEENDLGT
jgi:Fe-S-cluster containining protein